MYKHAHIQSIIARALNIYTKFYGNHIALNFINQHGSMFARRLDIALEQFASVKHDEMQLLRISLWYYIIFASFLFCPYMTRYIFQFDQRSINNVFLNQSVRINPRVFIYSIRITDRIIHRVCVYSNPTSILIKLCRHLFFRIQSERNAHIYIYTAISFSKFSPIYAYIYKARLQSGI